MIVDIIREHSVLLGLVWIAAKIVHLFVLHNQRGKTVFTDIDAHPCPFIQCDKDWVMYLKKTSVLY